MTQSNAAENPNTENKPESENGSEAPLSPLEAKLSELESALKEEKNKYLYLYADFDNYKKRMIKERSDLIKFGWENTARELLSVVDNLERAVSHSNDKVDANLKQGVEMTLTLFKQTLEKQGIAVIPSEGAIFNPELHEGMGQEPSSLPQGTITQTLVKGYTLHGRLLRPAKVVVSTGVAPTN